MAASVETLLMPGPLTQAHAEFETECSQCHARFDQGGQDQRCLNCHEKIAQDRANGSGLHGLHPDMADMVCSGCHTDHKGREFDIGGLVADLFDHSHTDFALHGLHQHTACNACHTEERSKRDAPSACADCHGEDNPHEQPMDGRCSDCHAATGWLNISFDHAGHTDFRLEFGHALSDCSACHQVRDFTDVASECVTCHGVDDVHAGQMSDDCGSCHTSVSWSRTEFAHEAQTGFALQGGHRKLECASCHLKQMALQRPPTSCAGCHASGDPHQGRRGTACDDCHTSETWRVQFNHFAESGFALSGAHAQLECKGCHVVSLQAPLEPACFACHVHDDPHGGKLTKCGECHGSDDWRKSVLFHHDLTRFPLLGSHRLTTCEQCHEGLKFSVASGQGCADCHERDNPHGEALGSDCARCHTPVDWTLWQFDHNAQTTFELSGAHEALICESCHPRGGGNRTLSSCNACHRQDDPHRGGFGTDCHRCHSTTSFGDLHIGRRPSS